MGFIFDKSFVMDPDVHMGTLLSKEGKISIIKEEYRDTHNVEIINPTIDIINYFRDRIKYLPPTTICSAIRNNHLERWNQLPNLYEYLNREEVIKHLEDKTKIYYLSKVVKMRRMLSPGYLWKLYVYEKSDIQNQRNNKLTQLGI